MGSSVVLRTAAEERASIYRLTEASPMKPFITPDISPAGKKALAIQFEGISQGELWAKIGNYRIVACSMPKGQSFQTAWIFRLIFENECVLEFSSASTVVVDWQEVGSLNISLASHPTLEPTAENFEAVTINVPAIRVSRLDKLIYEDSDVISECGLVFGGDGGEEVVISAGIPPGSVSVSAPFSWGPFEPQFEIQACIRERV